MNKPITSEDMLRAGVPEGRVFGLAQGPLQLAAADLGKEQALARLLNVLKDPESALNDEYFAPVAEELILQSDNAIQQFTPRDKPAPYESWCPAAEAGALRQIEDSMKLPNAVRGALMPDAHQGYGLPIGGVLALRNAIAPNCVGVDVSCSMSLTFVDMPATGVDTHADQLEKALLEGTFFGAGTEHARWRQLDAEALDARHWQGDRFLYGLRDKAARQLGTSGSGNHFSSWVTIDLPSDDLGLPAGTYLGLISHSGSRGAGASIAAHYTKIAREQHPDLPQELLNLAWLDLGTVAGEGYWHAMNLMHDYARACHEVIHSEVMRLAGVKPLLNIFNSHNLAWKEIHDGEELIVHRKGATPAGKGVLGVIPGTMADPGFVVRGKGNPASLNSASHGAGRRMSRTQARNSFRWAQVRPYLEERGVKLLGAGIDENPHAYKDIHEVMAQQTDLVEKVAQVNPRIVRMADDSAKDHRRRASQGKGNQHKQTHHKKNRKGRK